MINFRNDDNESECVSNKICCLGCHRNVTTKTFTYDSQLQGQDYSYKGGSKDLYRIMTTRNCSTLLGLMIFLANIMHELTACRVSLGTTYVGRMFYNGTVLSNIIHAGLGMCVETCKMTSDCTFINHNRCHLTCDLMAGNEPRNESDFTLDTCMIFVSLKIEFQVSPCTYLHFLTRNRICSSCYMYLFIWHPRKDKMQSIGLWILGNRIWYMTEANDCNLTEWFLAQSYWCSR